MSKFILINIDIRGPIKTELSYITGSAIRGAYINKYINKNKIKEDISLNKEYREKLLSNNIKFYDAYPRIGDNYSISTPLCFYASKDKIKEFSRDNNTIGIKNELNENIEEGFQRVNKSDFSILKNNLINLVSIKRVENLHNCKQINEENLFRYEAIDKNQQFYTIVQCEDYLVDEVKDTFDKEIVYIGGSKSSGYGMCELKIEGIYNINDIKNRLNIGIDKEQEYLTIYFASNTVLRDDFGNVISYIPEKELEEKLGINNVKIIKSTILSTDIKGYNAMWKSYIPSVTAIKSGSIISYSYEGKLDYDKVRDFEINGIGSKKQEGYGRIYINPSFNVTECRNYQEDTKVEKINIKLDKEANDTLTTILNNINKSREDEYLTKIQVEALDSKTDSRGIKKVQLKEFPNAQAGKLINIIDQAIDKIDSSGEVESKNYMKNFKHELKTKTKNLYINTSKAKLFGECLFDYLDELISDKSIEDLTGSRFKLEYATYENIKLNKSSDYKLKLLLTKKLLTFNLRKNGGEK